MNQNRRNFFLSSLGIGGALAYGNAAADGRGLRVPPGRIESVVVGVHEDPEFSCFEVSLGKGRGGDVIATFGRAPAGLETGDILAIRSKDGVTWPNSKPVRLFSRDEGNGPSCGHQLASITSLADGTLIACSTKFRFLFEGKVGWRRGSELDGVYVRRSLDGGFNWGDVQKVDITPYRVAWARGAVIETPDGSLLLPLSGQQGERYSEAEEPISTFLLRSVDQGIHWKFHSTVAMDTRGGRDFDEPAMVSQGGRRLLCMLRSHEIPRRDPLGGYLHTTRSDDGGATWTPAQQTSMWGHPANLLCLRDGRILCTYGHRMHPDPGVRGCVSVDGRDWRPQDAFIINAQPDLSCDRMQIGCPSSAQLDDGRILTAYQVWARNKNDKAHNGSAEERQCLEASIYRV